MARFKDGIVKGKVGPVVNCQWKGKPYLRARAVRTAPPTPGEDRNRFVFDLVNAWLKPIHDFVRVGFRNYSDTFWGINAASSLLHKEALHRDGFNSSIDPSLVKVSHGNIGLPAELEILPEGEEIGFFWSTEPGPDKDPRDRIILLAYNIDQETAVMNLSGPQRFQGYAHLSLKPLAPGPYHLYAAFTAARAEDQSDSRYLGNYEL